MRAQEFIQEDIADEMSVKDMIAYLRQHHDKNLHPDYLNHLTDTNSKFVLKNIPLTSIRTELAGLDRAKVEQYKQMDFSKAPPIVVGSDGNILDGYHRATVANALGIPSIRAYVGMAKQGVAEVKILSRIKGKGSEPGQLPRFGRSIEPGREEYYLGKQVGKFGRYTLWKDWVGGQLSYHLFDPQERRVIVTTFGSRYRDNPDSYIIAGLYAAPGNTVKAHQFYRALIRDQGLTLVSDNKQSPGGNRVWQQLERYPDITVYGLDSRTGEIMNFGARDSEMYAIPADAVKDRDSSYVANNIRLVATQK
jgi:hypothetical protein